LCRTTVAGYSRDRLYELGYLDYMQRQQGLDRPLTLAVLALLAEMPRHPYDMRRTIRERLVERVVKVRGGSLYDAVNRLEKAGLIEQVGSDRAGARPERTVYAITDIGRGRLLAMMEEYVGQPVNEYPRFVSALAHLALLEPPAAVSLLRRRAAALEGKVARTEQMLAECAGDVPRLMLLEEEYVQLMRRREIAWLYEVATDIERGEVPWPVLDEGV
jgi:DNA-binding PadR family transcriptional regulator